MKHCLNICLLLTWTKPALIYSTCKGDNAKLLYGRLCYLFHRSVFVVAMSEEVLLARVKALEEEVERLKAQLREEREERTETSASLQTESLKHQEGEENRSKQKKRGAERPFDFSVHPRRHVALRLAYLGWQYQGFAVQENTDNTVEARLFEALLKTKLIQDRQTSIYHRCGRTDKGVSAFSQVLQSAFNEFCVLCYWSCFHIFQGYHQLTSNLYLYSWYNINIFLRLLINI